MSTALRWGCLSASARQRRRVVCVAERNETTPRPKRRGELSGKTGKELREAFFMAAQTGSERGLPEGAFLNDNTTGAEATTEITWEPYGDTCTAPQGSNILRAGVEAGAFEITPAFCLTGQCDSCLVELDSGEAVLGCMCKIPEGREQMTISVVATDEVWAAMLAGGESEDDAQTGAEDDDIMFV